jgi:hypothetical protein
MWANMICQEKACFWEDVWDPRSWRIGKEETFGYDWFNYAPYFDAISNFEEHPDDAVDGY